MIYRCDAVLVALMVDANQSWTLEQACEIAPRLEAFGLGWRQVSSRR